MVSLIHKYLRSGVIDKGLWHASEEGTPQGGPLSPLLSNIMLNELDKELARRGHPFVRYADDSMIFCKTKRAAERVQDSITKFIEGKLFLKVNKEKTVVSYIRGVNIHAESKEGGLLVSYGFVSRMESKIGTAVCRTARTVVREVGKRK